MRKRLQRIHRRGFTLVEVLIVVVILGILAATVLPQFTSASNDAKESALIQDLQTIRAQIELFKFQHKGFYPGQGSALSSAFKDQMLLTTSIDRTTGALGTLPLGPYFVGQLPPNPFNGGRGVAITDDVPGFTTDETLTDGPDLVGWIYDPDTGLVKANCEDLAADGDTLLSEL